jgi:hypothetical protein
MKKILIPVLIGLCISCSIFKNKSGAEEDVVLVTTRRFAGVFIDYRATVTEELPKLEVIWIKTSLESRYGKICAIGKKCEFSKGDRLYFTKKFYSPGMIGGKWEYYIENDSLVIYKLTEYQSDRKVLTETWF